MGTLFFLLAILAVVGVFTALAVLAVVFFLSRSRAQTQTDDVEVYLNRDSENPYASSNVVPRRGRQGPWLLAGVVILAFIVFLCLLSGVGAVFYLNASSARPVGPPPTAPKAEKILSTDDETRTGDTELFESE